jgi:hypothetical protein
MNYLKHLLIFITLASTMIGTLAKGATTTNLIPSVLSGLQDSKPDTYYSKVKDIPTPIMDAFQKAMGVRELRMADSGGAWNMTDMVDDPSLPFCRLIWAAEIKGCCVIHYETGGVRYGTQYMIAAPDEIGERWVVLWAASGSNPVRDYPAFIAELKDGKIHTDSRMIHQR